MLREGYPSWCCCGYRSGSWLLGVDGWGWGWGYSLLGLAGNRTSVGNCSRKCFGGVDSDTRERRRFITWFREKTAKTPDELTRGGRMGGGREARGQYRDASSTRRSGVRPAKSESSSTSGRRTRHVSPQLFRPPIRLFFRPCFCPFPTQHEGYVQ